MAERKENMDKNRMEEMKEEYISYPVPEIAQDRIKAGIAQAKKEESQMRRRWCRKTGRIAGVTAAAAMAAIVLLANSSEHVAKAMEQIPVIGALTKVVTFRNYSDSRGGFEANVDVPQITDENVENQESVLGINKTIEEYANQLIAMYERDLQESSGEGHYMLESSYEVIRDDERYLSIRINSLLIMASGNQFVKIFNVDKNTGRILTLADLPGGEESIEAISENIKEQMQEKMAADEMLTYFIYSEEEPYGFDKVTEENNFYINENNEIVVVFDEYQVAPGYMGVVEFVVPKKVASFE